VADNLGVISSTLPLLFFDGPGAGDNCGTASYSSSISSELDVDEENEYCSKLC